MSTVNFKNLDFSKIILDSPGEKPSVGGGVSYPINFQYNFGTDEEPDLKRFYLECPEVRSYGIKENVNKDGTIAYSLRAIVIDPEESAIFEKILDHIQERSIKTVLHHAYEKTIPILDFDKADGDVMNTKMFKKGLGGLNDKTGKLYHYPMDDLGTRKPDSCASIFIKLDTGERSKGFFRSRFFDLAKKDVPWDMLYDIGLHFVPVLNINRIYIGKQNSIQFRTLKSAFITDVQEGGADMIQSDSIDNFLKEHPDQLDALEEKIRLLRENMAGIDPPPATERRTTPDFGLGTIPHDRSTDPPKSSLEDFMGEGGSAISSGVGLEKPPSLTTLKGFS